MELVQLTVTEPKGPDVAQSNHIQSQICLWKLKFPKECFCVFFQCCRSSSIPVRSYQHVFPGLHNILLFGPAKQFFTGPGV